MKPIYREELIKNYVENNVDYIYIQDIDDCECVTASKNKTVEMLNLRISPNNIAVVIKVIESWYLALMNQKSSKKYLRQNVDSTENYSKAKFEHFIPEGCPRIVFMLKLLEEIDFESAKRKNQSFEYFFEKWINPIIDS